MLVTSSHARTREVEALVECTHLEADRMRELLSSDVKAAKLSITESLESAKASLGGWSSRTNAGSLYCSLLACIVSIKCGQFAAYTSFDFVCFFLSTKCAR